MRGLEKHGGKLLLKSHVDQVGSWWHPGLLGIILWYRLGLKQCRFQRGYRACLGPV